MLVNAISAGKDHGQDAQLQSVAEYLPEIFDQLFREETAGMPDSGYMEQQADINAKMRAILIDWLVEVHMKHRLQTETLYLTVNLIDRYLARALVLRKRLQLVGVVAMFIASKFEEVDPPRVKDFVYITDNTYTKEELLSMECTMLATLDFQIVVPTPAHFLDHLLRANRCEETHGKLTEYILELTLIHVRFTVCYAPSHLVAAALMLSNELMGRVPVWPASMEQQTRHFVAVRVTCLCDCCWFCWFVWLFFCFLILF
ncbi:unnamed protein product [Polarella glacialis]|uniref:Cyclin-like domain-containing protein n=1 Tax=Polarella glacialis TaxID=89957 RepID=A0A813GL76_POLGL|nr:unnamed protein product [Polarella glacialis]